LRWHRQIPMFGYIVDFWCPSQKLIVEVNESDTPSSAKRDAVFASHGVRILHFSEDDIWARLPGVIEVIRQATIGSLP
jgi:very-short-patch-repair endonuclease